jgi:CO/xanthine dehydrogenase FAD-binding subunit
MRSHFEYVALESLEETKRFLASHGDKTALLAGGTDLMISVRKGDLASKYVLDVSRLEEMRSIGLRDGVLEVGAGATFSEIVESRVVLEAAPVLAKACRHIGSLQIRNVGTIGGNVINASPAADGVPPLIVHNARALVESASGRRLVPILELITGPYLTGLRQDELVTMFLLDPFGDDFRSCFHRIARRRALAIARMNVAAAARLDGAGTIRDVRIAVGSVTPIPCRMTAAEDHLTGQRPTMDAIGSAAQLVSQEMVRQSGIRHSTEYKKPAVEGLTIKALTELLLE